MKVLLVEPRNCWIGLNIALGYLAAFLKQAGIEVKVLDLANHRNWPEEKMERSIIMEFKPDLIGISLFYIGYYPVKHMIKRIKSYYPCPIVVGGPQMMIEKENILKDIEELDYAVVGDGEDALVELCRAVRGEMPLSAIDGLIYRENGEVIKNPDRKVTADIDRLPFPDYKPFGVNKINLYSIITSRGCPYSCAYCFRSTRKWRPRSPENIVAELKQAAVDYQIKEFAVVDDAFNILPERVFQICDLLEAQKINLPWYCTGVRADRMTDELARRMRQAGCYRVNIGIETLQPEIYEKLNRNMSMSQVTDCLRILKKNGITSVGYFMIGLPGETKEKSWDTFRKAKAMGVDDTSYAILLPMPGTKMYDMVYSLPGVKKLHDYKTISTVWTFAPEYSRMQTAFETPEYPAADKIEMYNKIRTMEGDPRPPYHKSMIVFALSCLYWVFKYDFAHSPKTIYKLARNFLSRFIKARGKHVYKFDIQYDAAFLQDLESRMEQGG